MTALDIVGICADLGLRIEPFEQRLLIVDERHDPPFVAENLFHLLVENRDEIRDQLTAGHLYKQILLGEHDGSDDSARRALAASLRTAGHPLARRALERLEASRP